MSDQVKGSTDVCDQESVEHISNKEALDFIRREISHEFSLLNYRITWFLLCEAILIAGYVALFNIENNSNTILLSNIFKWIGFLLSIAAFFSIWTARETINIWRNRQHNLFKEMKNCEELKKITTERVKMSPAVDFIHQLSAILSYAIPITLFFCWFCMIAFSEQLGIQP